MAFRGPGCAVSISGSHWADIVGAGSFGPRFMVSERVITDLREIRATGFVPYAVEIQRIESYELQVPPTPRYYYLEITGSITIDWKASKLHEPCERCGAPLKIETRKPDWLIPVQNSWDGSDFFRGHPYGGPFCSERVLQLARRNRWVDFQFLPVAPTDYPIAEDGSGIDYLSDEWPDERTQG
jgi:hypothetical protein